MFYTPVLDFLNTGDNLVVVLRRGKVVLAVLKKVIEKTLGIEIRRKQSSPDDHEWLFESYVEALKHCPKSEGYEFSLLVGVISEKTKVYAESLYQEVPEVSIPQSFAINVLQRIALQNKSISVIDFGGACGAHYLLARRLLYQEISLKWHVVETPMMVKEAIKSFRSTELNFFESVDQAVSAFSGKVDLVFTSSALQYTDDPFRYLDQLLKIRAKQLAFFRANMTLQEESEIRIQRSLLSANGIGPLPTKYKDIEIFYPITVIPVKKFMQTLQDSGYRLSIRFHDQTGVVRNSQIGFAGLFTR